MSCLNNHVEESDGGSREGDSISKVRSIETITRYDASTQEFIILIPFDSAQKYWIGGAANVRPYISKFYLE
ncbi:hypothetical protein Tco_1512536 [Tanacetum coccineum]